MCGLAAALAVLAAASPGDAATVSVSGTTVIYQAAPGEVNKPLVDTIGTAVVFGDSVAPTFGPGCAPFGQTGAKCSGGRARLAVEGGTGKDFIIGTTGSDTLSGGSGNDSVYGSGGSDVLRAGRAKTGSRASEPSRAVPAATSSRRSMASPATTSHFGRASLQAEATTGC